MTLCLCQKPKTIANLPDIHKNTRKSKQHESNNIACVPLTFEMSIIYHTENTKPAGNQWGREVYIILYIKVEGNGSTYLCKDTHHVLWWNGHHIAHFKFKLEESLKSLAKLDKIYLDLTVVWRSKTTDHQSQSRRPLAILKLSENKICA